MGTLTIALLLAVLSHDCPCGPDCRCGPDCKCLQNVSAKVEDKLPTLEACCKQSGSGRKPIVCWVGKKNPDGQAQLAGCAHCYADAIDQRDGPGVVVGRPVGQTEYEWTWFAGELSSLSGVRRAAGLDAGAATAPTPAGSGSLGGVFFAPQYAAPMLFGGCGPMGCGAGGCGPMGCGPGGCGPGGCGGGGGGGFFGRRR